MNEGHQLANALLTVIFAAAMFVVGHLYIETRSTGVRTIPSAHAFVPWTTPCKTLLGSRDVRTRINRSVWSSAMPEMPSPSNHSERCLNTFRLRVLDAEMHELRPRLWRASAHRPRDVRCPTGGWTGQRASFA